MRIFNQELTTLIIRFNVEKKFRYCLDNFRGLAIIFVMLSHVGSFDELGFAGHLANYLVVNATSWFVFLSGYLFTWVESERFSYSNYLLKKFKFVILPYLLLSALAICAGFFLHREQLLVLNAASYVVWSLIVGGSVIGPMWFVPMIAIFFLISPMLRRLGTRRILYPAAFLAVVFSLFSSRPLNNTNPLLSFLHFLGFYLLGMVFSKNATYIDAFKSSTRWRLATSGCIFFIFSACFYGLSQSDESGFFAGLGRFNMVEFGKLTLLIAVFFLFEQCFNQPNRVLGYFAKISFGLFFLHGFHMALFSKFRQFVPNWSAVIILLSEIAFVVVAPIATVYLLKRILGRNSRYVIGC